MILAEYDEQMKTTDSGACAPLFDCGGVCSGVDFGGVISLTDDEKRLLLLYNCGSAIETADALRQALPDIYEPTVRSAAEGLMAKLLCMDGELLSIDNLFIGVSSFADTAESEGHYG